MGVANVVTLSAPHAVHYARSGHPAGVNPVRVRFDAFELDEPNALLLRLGKAVTLAPKPFGVLCALARRPGSLLTKHALLDDVWGHQFVTDSVLKTAISEVRAALNDDPKVPRYIETVSRRGYRFIATIRASLQHPPAIERDGLGRARPSRLSSAHGLCRATQRSLSSFARSQPRWRASRSSSAIRSQTRPCMNHAEQRQRKHVASTVKRSSPDICNSFFGACRCWRDSGCTPILGLPKWSSPAPATRSPPIFAIR